MAQMEPQGAIVLATPPPISHRTAEENLGIGYLTAVLRERGFAVRIIDGWLEGLVPSKIAKIALSFNPLWIGLACYRSNIEPAISVLRQIKLKVKEIPVIVGGFGPTFYPSEFLEAGFDIVVRGEAEETVVDLSRHFIDGAPALEDIPGITFRAHGRQVDTPPRRLFENIDALPFPARDTLPLAKQRRSAVHVVSSRGCAAHCNFCSIVSFMRLASGPKWRQRSIGNFVDELESLAAQGARGIKVIDDSLIEPPRDAEWCETLAREINTRRLRLRLRGSIRADRVTEKIIAPLCRAGFFAFSCGIENFAESALKRMGKTATTKDNHLALELFQKHRLYIQAGHILFDHGTTLDELWTNLVAMRRYDWTICKGVFTEMFAAQGTPYTRTLERKGLLQRASLGVEKFRYEIQDEPARKVYTALKLWHKMHMRLYDKTIDVISSPKALEDWEMSLFHPLCIALRRRDLDILESLLLRVTAGASDAQLNDYILDETRRQQDWDITLMRKVNDAYDAVGLFYDAEENPFVC